MRKMVSAVKNWATNILNLALSVMDFNWSKPQFSSDKMEIVLVLHFRGFLNVSLVVLVKLGVLHIAVFVLLKM